MAPAFGKRLIPTVIDERARQEPDHVFASYAMDREFFSFRDVTYGQLGKAIDRLAWWIHTEIGTSDSFKTICYLGTPSILNFLLIMSAIKTGHQLLIVDPNQPAVTIRDLLQATRCEFILVDDKPAAPVLVLQSSGVRLTPLPDIDHWLDDQGSTEQYPYHKTFEEARFEPFVALTTSGSTKAPKVVVMRHGTIAHHDLIGTDAVPTDPPTAYGQLDNQRVLSGMSMTHSAGISLLTFAVFSNSIPVLGPPLPGYMPADVAHADHLQGNVSASLLTPWVVIELSGRPETLEGIRKLKYLTYGGLSIPQSTGDLLAKHTHLFTLFGATETGVYALDATDREDWQWLHISPRMGAVFKEGSKGTYQMVFERSKSTAQGVFHTFPELEEYDTNDLFIKHPTKPNYYLHQGRADLLLRLSHGQWINPIPYEATIDSSPLVLGSLLYRYGQDVPSLLVEVKSPPSDTDGEKNLLDQLWPTIEAANQRLYEPKVPVPRELVMFTTVAKPMLRSFKDQCNAN